MPIIPPFGGGGTGVARTPVTVSGSPFADLAALETWSQANPSELLNNSTQFAVAMVGPSGSRLTYEWVGQDGVYSTDSWSNQTGLTPQQSSAVDSIVNLPDDSIPVSRSGALRASLGVQTEEERVSFDGAVGSDKSDLSIGDNLSLSEDGATVRLNDPIDNIQALAAGTLLNSDGTTGINFALRRDNLQSIVLQPNDDETVVGTWTAHVPVTGNRIIKRLRTRFAQNATGIRIVIRQAADVSDTTGAILYQSHTESDWNNGAGLSVTSSPEGGPSTYEIILENSAKVLLGSLVYVEVAQNSQGTGTLELRGSTETIGTVTQFYAYLEQTFVEESQVELAAKEDLGGTSSYATITNFERIDNNWEAFGTVQLDNTASEVTNVEVNALKAQNNNSNHDFRIVYGGTNASHAGEIYYTGNLTASTAGGYIVTMTATATPIPSEADVILESQAMRNSGSRVDHQSTMITYQER